MLVCVCVSAPEIPSKIPNEPHREEWQPALGPLKQQWINLLPHTVNHLHLRWGPGGEAGLQGPLPPQDSAFLWRPPAVKGQDEGASKRDGNPSNQTTQVVHLGGRLYVKPDGKQKMGLLSNIPGSRGKLPLAMNPGEQKQSTSFQHQQERQSSLNSVFYEFV